MAVTDVSIGIKLRIIISTRSTLCSDGDITTELIQDIQEIIKVCFNIRVRYDCNDGVGGSGLRGIIASERREARCDKSNVAGGQRALSGR